MSTNHVYSWLIINTVINVLWKQCAAPSYVIPLYSPLGTCQGNYACYGNPSTFGSESYGANLVAWVLKWDHFNMEVVIYRYTCSMFWRVQSRQRDNPLPPTITYDCQKIQEAPPPFFNPSHPPRNGHLFRFLRLSLLLFWSHHSSSALIVGHNLQFNCVLTNMFMMTE